MDKKIEIISWVDAQSIDEWMEISEIDINLPVMYSAGIVLKENKSVLVICSNWDPSNEKASCIMMIPKKMIKQRWAVNNQTQ